jgi:GTP-binding protein
VLLFLIPADSPDIMGEYNILLKELKEYNEELLFKRRVLAISKSDLLDQELIDEIKTELPDNLPTIFISSLTSLNIMPLKDLLWKVIHE